LTLVRTTTTPVEAASVSAICFGWAIITSSQSVAAGFQSSSFTDSNMLGLIGMEVVFGAIALLLLYARGYSVSNLYPSPSLAGLGLGVGLYIASLMTSWVAVAPFAASQPSQPIDALVSSASVSLSSVIAVALVNGAYEEVFLLGFLLRGLRGYGLSIALGVSLLVRVLYHLYQGPLGAVSVLAFGLVLSLYYIRTNALFPVVFAHVLADVIPFV
jgi:membrane protease YdiL (CAAX protease family)